VNGEHSIRLVVIVGERLCELGTFDKVSCYLLFLVRHYLNGEHSVRLVVICYCW